MGSDIYANRKALLELQMALAGGQMGGAQPGYEAGGLLLGASGADIRIEAVLPFHIEHRFGPFFWLTPADIVMVKLDIELASDSEQGAPIGHFRSVREGEPEAIDIDHAIADLLPVAEPVLFLIPAAQNGPMQVMIYRREGGTWVPLLHTPVDDILSPPTVARTPVAAAPVAAVPSAAPSELRAELPAAAVARRPWLWTGLALLLVLTAALLWNYLLGPRRRPLTETSTNTAAPRIGLEAHASGSAINVRWNRTSAMILQATSATLIIQDGDKLRELRLKREELLNGTVAYAPVSGRVTFRLDVYRDRDHYMEESVSLAVPVVPKPVPPPQTASISRESQAASRRSPISVEVLVRAPSEPLAPRSIPDTGAAPIVSLPPAPPPNLALATPPPTAAAQPPAVPAALGELLASRPVPRPEVPITYVAATPLRKTKPAIPANLRAVIDSMVSVNVKVMIDASGKVVSAAPMDTTSAAEKLLAPEAVQAARLWRFEPARRNGLPVSSESMLRFDFERR